MMISLSCVSTTRAPYRSHSWRISLRDIYVRRMQLDEHQLTAAGAVFFEVYRLRMTFQP